MVGGKIALKTLALVGELVFNQKVRDDWTKVELKKAKKRRRVRIISNNDSVSCVDRKAKADPGLKDLG